MICWKNGKTAAADQLCQPDQQSHLLLQGHSQFLIRENKQYEKRLIPFLRIKDQGFLKVEDAEAPTRSWRQSGGQIWKARNQA